MDVTLESDVEAVSEWNVSGSICSKDGNTVQSPGNGKLFDLLPDRPMKTHVGGAGSRTTDAASRNVGNSGIQCPICDRVLAKKAGHLKRHMLVHTGEKPYPCPLCARSFSTKHNMTRHVNTVHRGEVTKEPESTLGSNMILTSEHAFAKHTPTPHLGGDCWAGQAGGWTPAAVPVGHVAAVGDGRRAERCSLCCKVFCSRRALKRHMKVVHLEEKPICAAPFFQHETGNERRHLAVPQRIVQENETGEKVSEVTPPFTLEMMLSEDDSISSEKDDCNFKQDFDLFQQKERQNNGKLGPLCYENETSGESNILDLSLRAVEDPLKCDASDIQTQTVASDCQNMITMIERPIECLTQIRNQSQSETGQLHCNQKDYFINNILDLTLKTGKNTQPCRLEENENLAVDKCDDTDQGTDCNQSTHCTNHKKVQIQGRFDVATAPKRTKTGERDTLTVKAVKGSEHHGSHLSGRNGRATVPRQAPPSSSPKSFYCLACCQAFVSGSALEDHVFERHS